MEFMDKYKIQESIEDVIRILDAAPIKTDWVQVTNIVQLTNRVPIAHLAIERGLKSLIKKGGKSIDHIHKLHKLYGVLNDCDEMSADFLAKAFDDAVGFFGYKVNDKGFGHFRSLESYLSNVGNESVFETLRYWATGDIPQREQPIPFISLRVHREILCALSCLFLRDSRQTVSERVDAAVSNAMFLARDIHWGTDDVKKKDSVYWYRNWLYKVHSTCRSALKEAIQLNFAIGNDDEFATQTLRDAYDDLRQSKDPAVQYYLRRCSYLPRESQPRHPDATPIVEWIDKENRGSVETPAGTCLGLIGRYEDGAWGIAAAEPGSGGETDVAEAQADAKHYLVNRRTKRVTVLVNADSKQLRIVGEPKLIASPEWTANVEDELSELSGGERYEMEFWDSEHGIKPGDEIVFEMPSRGSTTIGWCYEGSVTRVEAQMTTMDGVKCLSQIGKYPNT